MKLPQLTVIEWLIIITIMAILTVFVIGDSKQPVEPAAPKTGAAQWD